MVFIYKYIFMNGEDEEKIMIRNNWKKMIDLKNYIINNVEIYIYYIIFCNMIKLILYCFNLLEFINCNFN